MKLSVSRPLLQHAESNRAMPETLIHRQEMTATRAVGRSNSISAVPVLEQAAFIGVGCGSHVEHITIEVTDYDETELFLMVKDRCTELKPLDFTNYVGPGWEVLHKSVSKTLENVYI